MAPVRMRRRGTAAPAAGSGRKPGPVVSIDKEERRHLIEDCAFFRVQQYREAAPGRYRKEDLRSATGAIDSVIKPARVRKKT